MQGRPLADSSTNRDLALHLRRLLPSTKRRKGACQQPARHARSLSHLTLTLRHPSHGQLHQQPPLSAPRIAIAPCSPCQRRWRPRDALVCVCTRRRRAAAALPLLPRPETCSPAGGLRARPLDHLRRQRSPAIHALSICLHSAARVAHLFLLSACRAPSRRARAVESPGTYVISEPSHPSIHACAPRRRLVHAHVGRRAYPPLAPLCSRKKKPALSCSLAARPPCGSALSSPHVAARSSLLVGRTAGPPACRLACHYCAVRRCPHLLFFILLRCRLWRTPWPHAHTLTLPGHSAYAMAASAANAPYLTRAALLAHPQDARDHDQWREEEGRLVSLPLGLARPSRRP